MRGAPPVLMACGRDAWVAASVALPAGAAAASIAAWLAWHGGLASGWVMGAAAVAALVGCGLGWGGVLRRGRRQLAWDGRHWTLDGQPGEVTLLADAGSAMLLRFHAAGAATWLPLRPGRCDAPAHLVRAALHAHAGHARPDTGPARHG